MVNEENITQSSAGCLQSTPLSSPPHSHRVLSLNASLSAVHLGGCCSLPTDKGLVASASFQGSTTLVSYNLVQSKAAALPWVQSHRSREVPQESTYSGSICQRKTYMDGGPINRTLISKTRIKFCTLYSIIWVFFSLNEKKAPVYSHLQCPYHEVGESLCPKMKITCFLF